MRSRPLILIDYHLALLSSKYLRQLGLGPSHHDVDLIRQFGFTSQNLLQLHLVKGPGKSGERKLFVQVVKLIEQGFSAVDRRLSDREDLEYLQSRKLQMGSDRFKHPIY